MTQQIISIRKTLQNSNYSASITSASVQKDRTIKYNQWSVTVHHPKWVHLKIFKDLWFIIIRVVFKSSSTFQIFLLNKAICRTYFIPCSWETSHLLKVGVEEHVVHGRDIEIKHNWTSMNGKEWSSIFLESS